MPEGHTVHRYARQHHAALAGQVVTVSSPQGRFDEGAALLDGRVLTGVEAYGKHLFYRWQRAGTLHVHLGLFGRFVRYDGQAPAPTAGTRLALCAAGPGTATTVHLSGPTACRLLDPHAEDLLRARLGPDPLRDDADREAMWAGLQRRRSAIGTVLLDQRLVAGIGNAFRAEALFLCGIAPARPANALTRAEFEQLWATLGTLLRDGLRSGEIRTVSSAEAGVGRRRLSRDEARFVYRRAGQPCWRCGAAIGAWQLGGRTMYACATCQPV